MSSNLVIMQCKGLYDSTCWSYSSAYLGVESSVCQITIFPVIFLVFQTIFEGVRAPRALSNGTPFLPLGLKLAAIGEVQYPVAMKPVNAYVTWSWEVKKCASCTRPTCRTYIPSLNSPTYFVPVGKRNSPFPSILCQIWGKLRAVQYKLCQELTARG